MIHPFGRVMLTPSGTASKARDTELASEGAAVLETEREKKERERENMRFAGFEGGAHI